MHLLDTNVVIDYLKGEEAVVNKINNILEDGLAISTVSLAELYYGAQRSNDPLENEEKIERFVNIPEIEILALSQEIAREYGYLMRELEKKGQKLATVDVLIASAARFKNLKILTADKKHVTRLKSYGIEVEVITSS